MSSSGGSKNNCISGVIKEPYLSLLNKLLEEMIRVLGENLVSFVVFGSVARCEAGPDSDVDLLIVAKNLPKGRLKRQDLFMEIEEKLEEDIESLRQRGFNVDFSPIIKSVEEASVISPLYLDMVEDAVVLYDKDGFFSKILESVRAKLRELGAERIRVGKKWYWRLKKEYRFGEVIEI